MSVHNPQHWNDVCLNGRNMDWIDGIKGKLCYNYFKAIDNALTERKVFGVGGGVKMRMYLIGSTVPYNNDCDYYPSGSPGFEIDDNNEINYSARSVYGSFSETNNMYSGGLETKLSFLNESLLTVELYDRSNYITQYLPSVILKKITEVPRIIYNQDEYSDAVGQSAFFYTAFGLWLDVVDGFPDDVTVFPAYINSNREGYMSRFFTDLGQAVMFRTIPYADYFEQAYYILNNLLVYNVGDIQPSGADFVNNPAKDWNRYYIDEEGLNSYATAFGGYYPEYKEGFGATFAEAYSNMEASDWIKVTGWNVSIYKMGYGAIAHIDTPQGCDSTYSCTRFRTKCFFDTGHYSNAYSILYRFYLRAIKKDGDNETEYRKPSSFSDFRKWTFFGEVQDSARNYTIDNDAAISEFFSVEPDWLTYYNSKMLVHCLDGISVGASGNDHLSWEPDYDVYDWRWKMSGVFGVMNTHNGFKFRAAV